MFASGQSGNQGLKSPVNLQIGDSNVGVNIHSYFMEVDMRKIFRMNIDGFFDKLEENRNTWLIKGYLSVNDEISICAWDNKEKRYVYKDYRVIWIYDCFNLDGKIYTKVKLVRIL